MRQRVTLATRVVSLLQKDPPTANARWLGFAQAATLLLIVLMSPTPASGSTFGDWARDHGYSPDDVMPVQVWVDSPPIIDSLAGIGYFDWTTTPTINLRMEFNQISSVESGDFDGLTNLESLRLDLNQLSSIESGVFDGLTNLTGLHLADNQISSIESGAFSALTNLDYLQLRGNETLTELNLAEADFSSLTWFDLRNNVNITSVSLKNTVVNQTSLATLLDGGDGPCMSGDCIGIGEIDGITELDLSGIDFANITDLGPLYVMDDLTDLWLVNTLNLDAAYLYILLDNLTTMEGTESEGMLYMTQANLDDFGPLLVAWDAEDGHHVEILMLGDMDGDGGVDFDDIDAFVLGLTDPQDYQDLYGMPPEWKGDTDEDGDFDFDDIPGFVAILTPPGGSQGIPEPSTVILAAIGLIGIIRWRCGQFAKGMAQMS